MPSQTAAVQLRIYGNNFGIGADAWRSGDAVVDAETTTGAATTTTRPVRAANEEWYPDHAVLNATKDQLKAMTQFKYN